MTKDRKDSVGGSFKSTEIGRINRDIEKSMTGVFLGKRGAAGEALSQAKKREQYLFDKPGARKVRA